jgi:hypothetical protein
VSGIGHTGGKPVARVGSVAFPLLGFEDPMLTIPRPTPTCTRFQTTIEMPCIKCGMQMRLASIEPQGQQFDLLTYRCIPCVSEESFLQTI